MGSAGKVSWKEVVQIEENIKEPTEEDTIHTEWEHPSERSTQFSKQEDDESEMDEEDLEEMVHDGRVKQPSCLAEQLWMPLRILVVVCV